MIRKPHPRYRLALDLPTVGTIIYATARKMGPFCGRMNEMHTNPLLRRLMTVATLVVAALIFAPSGAWAHGGHSHAVPAAEAITPIEVVRSVESANVEQAVLVPEAQPEVILRSDSSGYLVPASKPKSPQSCPGGCCHSFGTGCCAAELAEPIEIGVPDLGRSGLDRAILGGAGITPDALPEPPKSLV